MQIIPAGIHRMLDFVTVLIFVLAPIVLGLTGAAAWLSYALAVVHLVLTLATHFPDSGARPVPFKVHGAIELIVGIVLVVLPWAVGWVGVARMFYVAIGAVILVVWALSRYRAQPA